MIITPFTWNSYLIPISYFSNFANVQKDLHFSPTENVYMQL